jgi:hypothetical protein
MSDCWFYIKYNNKLFCRVTFRLLVLVDFIIIGVGLFYDD